MRRSHAGARRATLAAVALLAFVRFLPEARPQHQTATPSQASSAAQPVADCNSCHVCDRPTSADPCLRPCARPSAAEMIQSLRQKHGPDVVILNTLEDRFLPVPFDHRGHAEMADMTRGCAVCHHYTPEGAEHPACKTCHEISPVREDIRKPGLKGAYHRQCLSCHREWTGATRCELCHHKKTGSAGDDATPPVPTKDDLIGQMHPPIPEPDVEIYTTTGTGSPAGKVLFRHREHIHRFGLRCAECHHEDNCLRCHENGRVHVQRTKTLDEHHKPCFDCHKGADCDRCHWEEGRPKPPPFDHASTGWTLNRFHEPLSCRACHPIVPFKRPDRNCNTCHDGWSPGTFDHAITGQRLNDTHAAFDCEECHGERQFDVPPTCKECHDEEENIRFPEQRPGPVVAVEATTQDASDDRAGPRNGEDQP